jgi:methyl-accepting chemotaxis protein
MASTSNKNRATSVGKSNQSPSKRSPKSPNTPKPNKPKGSMGLGLLLIAIGTSLIGLGGLGYLFYQELLSSARREVDRAADAETRQIETKLTDIRQTVDGVASGAKILSQQQPKPKVTDYQKLVADNVQNDSPIAGMGIASSGNLLFPPAKPLVPYVWKEQSGLKPETSGQKLAAPNEKLLSGDRPDVIKAPFYQATLKGQASWSQPYNALGKTIITYSAPISDGQKVVGIVNADAIASDLFSLIDTATNPEPSNESKIGFAVASSSGKVITDSYQFQATQTQNPAIAEALTSLAQQAKAKPSGIIQTGGHLWAYRKIAGSDLLFVAQLPESEITNKLIVLVGGAAVGISAILAIAILGFVNSLKKRLQPLTEECDRFLSQQGNAGANIAGKDEIDHLSLSLKSTFQQVKTNEIRLRGELSQSLVSDDDISTAAQIQQSSAETELMEAEVGDLLDVVSSMEEGDLTIEAQVNDRATGLVADTLNRLREKLVEIISSVLGTAQQVAQGAADLEELARTVVLNTAEQAQSVTQGQALTEQVAAIAQRSAAQVNVANQSLQEVRDTVDSGQTAINSLTDSISVLQTGSAQIVQRMKTLGEFVGLAEQFVQDQGQIASLTQVLALNATLVAARAAEQKDPKQFASVAREFESIAGQVNDLATQTNDGLTVLQQRTSQIQTVVTAIDAEVQNLSGLVSGFTSGVESSQAAFNSIQMATEEVVQIGQTITASSTEIADAAGSTASYISEIAQLADRTADLTRAARQQAEAMGNQAQQLLQGIQFFRLPESSGLANPVNNAIASEANFDSPDTSVNSLLDSAPASDANGNLGLAVPAIAVAAAATAVTFSQSQQATYDYDEEDNTATDSRYLEDMLDDGINSNPPESDVAEFAQEQNFGSVSENFVSGGVTDSQDQASALYSDLTDISLIEESLLADLKQEIYDESSFDDNAEEVIEALGDLPEEPTLKNPMEGVNESAIHDASSDPLIVSATSSFLEDTAFGTVSPLAEDANMNLPTSIDFTIPDLDDDFHIPKMDIESTLDDSNSFFDSTSVQDLEVNQSRADFDPFAMDDLTVIQSELGSDDYAIANNENVFDANTFDSYDDAIAENTSEAIDDNATSNVFEDYSQYASNDALNESLEESLEIHSNEAFTDTFDTSFDESPFDRAFDEALNGSLDEHFVASTDHDGTLDEPISEITDDEPFPDEPFPEIADDEFNYELAEQDANDVFNLDQPVDIYANNLENQDELANLPNQIPDVYLDASSDDEFSEEFTFELDESPLTNDADLSASDHLFDLSLPQETEEFSEELVAAFDDQVNDYLVPPIAPELEISSPPVEPSEQPSEEFTFELDENLSMDASDLDESDNFSDRFFDASPIQENEELISDPFDVSTNIQVDNSITQESYPQEASILDLPDEQLETDLSALFNESDESVTEFHESDEVPSVNLDDQFEFAQNAADNLADQAEELDSIWQTEENELNELDFSAPFDASVTPVSENLADPFDGSMNFEEEDSEDSFAPNLDISSEMDIQESPILELPEQQLEDISDDLSEDFSFEIEENIATDQPDLTSADEFFNDADAIQDIREFTNSFESQDEDADDQFVSEFAIAPEPDIQESVISALTENLPENISEPDLTSLFDEGENLEDQDSDLIWQTEAIASDLLESPNGSEEFPEAQTPDINTTSPNFDLPDFSQMEETNDALMDEVFNFDISDDAESDNADNFRALGNSLDEEPDMDFAGGLLSDSESDISSMFSGNLDDEEFDFSESLNDSVANTLDIDEHPSTFEVLTEDIDSDTELLEFSELLDADNSIADSSLGLEESVIFEAIANDLDVEVSANSSDLSNSETDSLGFNSEFAESTTDTSLEISDNWFDEITEDIDGDSTNFAGLDDDLSIGYPSEDEVDAMVEDDPYGFADNLLDSLMDESDEEVDNLSMNLPDLPTASDLLPNLDHETLEANDSELEGEIEFDFSAFDLPIEDSINTARAEIDDFLSGSLDIGDIVDESPQKQDEKRSDESIPKKTDNKLVEPDSSVTQNKNQNL